MDSFFVMHKKIITGFLVAATLLPVFAFAEVSTTTNNSTQIQALIQQITLLQQQLKNLMSQRMGSTTGENKGWTSGSSTPWGMPPGQMGKLACITLSRNLRQGDQGDDVKSLQEMLQQDTSSGFSASATGFFGPMTMKAMMKFQMNNGIASSTDGSVGPLTRGFFERRCGKGLDGGMGKMQSGDMWMMAIRGTVAANNTSNITVTTNSGTITANVTASTSIKVFASTSTPPTTGTIADVVVGKTVTVQGKKISDTAMDALMIGVGDNVPMMKMQGGPNDNGGPGKPPMGMMPINGGQGQGAYPGDGQPRNW